MATGFRLTAETGAGILQHTQCRHLFWNPNVSRWCAIAQDTTGNDWALWDKDGADPAAGAEGGWSHEVDDQVTPADVYVDTRDGSAVDNYFDESTNILHTISQDNNTERYQQWTYNSGADDWTHTVTNESPGIDMGSTNAPETNASLIVDGDGDPWIVYHDPADLKLKAIYRSGGAWTGTPVVIEATASTTSIGTLRVDAFRWQNAGAAGIMAVYTYGVSGGNKIRAAFRADSAALTASWTTEDVKTSATIDNHLCAMATELGSDTTSTVCVVVKRGSSSILDFYKRNSSGTWSETASIRTDSGRPTLAIDATNEEVYVFCGLSDTGSNTSVVYRKSDISAISFGSDVKVLEDDGVATFNLNNSVPDKPVTATTDLYMLGQSAGNFWWNRVTINAAAAAGRLLLVDPPGLDGGFGGGLSL